MAKILQSFLIRIPKEYKDEFIRTICKENLFRSIVGSIVLTMVEGVLIIFFREAIFNTVPIVGTFILFNMIYAPILWKSYKKSEECHVFFLKSIQFIYLIGLLLFGCALSIAPQNELASINPYIIAVFAIAAFFYLSPLATFVLFFASYLIFFFLLPQYQVDPKVVEILQVNAFVLNLTAWILSRMVFRMKLVSFIDKIAIEEKNRELKYLVIRDSMTSLLNHENIFIRLNEEIVRAKRIQYALALMMIDIDEFKEINDQYGHQAGDDVIVKVAQILVDTCRETDIIGRYGGDEFIIIMPNTTLQDAGVLAERLREKVEALEFSKGMRINVSGGISELGNHEYAEELIKSVDAQLYKAKANGRNRFEM